MLKRNPKITNKNMYKIPKEENFASLLMRITNIDKLLDFVEIG